VSGAGVPAARDPARGLVVVVAPDSFKGSLTSVEVARALARGWKRARPKDDIRLAPLADGGEGTLVAIEAAGGWEWRRAVAHDPLGREITARWLQSEDGRRAVVELAAASGLSRLAAGERDPVAASTFGTGEVLRAVLDAGVRRIDLGVGGSATTDGGLGILAALGLGRTLEPDLVVDLDAMDPRLSEAISGSPPT
jgi:glycerate kinase